MIIKTILHWPRNIDRFIKKCEIKDFLPKKILPTSKSAKKYKINSILFVFYLDIEATTVTHLLIKQHIKCFETFSEVTQN